MKLETSLTEHQSRYGDISERLQNLAAEQASQVSAENCVHLARALDELLRHPRFPFDLDNAKETKVKRKKADFPIVLDILSCDGEGCGKVLWDEDCWMPPNSKLDTAFCVECHDSGQVPEQQRNGLHLQRSRAPSLFITCNRRGNGKRRRAVNPRAVVVKDEDDSAPQDPQRIVLDTGKVKMLSATFTTVLPMMRSLRRRLTNGLMSGLVYLRSVSFFRSESSCKRIMNIPLSHTSGFESPVMWGTKGICATSLSGILWTAQCSLLISKPRRSCDPWTSSRTHTRTVTIVSSCRRLTSIANWRVLKPLQALSTSRPKKAMAVSRPLTYELFSHLSI